MLARSRRRDAFITRAGRAFPRSRDSFSSRPLAKEIRRFRRYSRENPDAQGIKGYEERAAVLIPKSLLLLKSFGPRGCHGVLKLLCLLLMCYYIPGVCE